MKNLTCPAVHKILQDRYSVKIFFFICKGSLDLKQCDLITTILNSTATHLLRHLSKLCSGEYYKSISISKIRFLFLAPWGVSNHAALSNPFSNPLGHPALGSYPAGYFLTPFPGPPEQI